MHSILNDGDRTGIITRVRSLSDSSTARWGRMSVTARLHHLRLSARMTVGELEVPSAHKRAFQLFPLKHLILYVFPFPKGAPTAPDLRPVNTASFDEDRAAVLTLLEQIGAGPKEGAGPEHPLFGPLSWREWGAVTYKHVDHHLKQFGV